MIDEIATASVVRHDLIHGVVIDHAEGSGEAKLIRLLRQEGGVFLEKKIHVTTAIILQRAVDANKLASRVLEMAAGLSAAASQNVGDKPAGEV